MIFEYRCDSCSASTEKMLPVAARNDPFPCDCGGTFLLVPSIPRVLWLDIGSKDGDFPSSCDKWVADRDRRRTREEENVKKHGAEYPNLLTV
jgi:hypothetical protein